MRHRSVKSIQKRWLDKVQRQRLNWDRYSTVTAIIELLHMMWKSQCKMERRQKSQHQMLKAILGKQGREKIIFHGRIDNLQICQDGSNTLIVKKESHKHFSKPPLEPAEAKEVTTSQEVGASGELSDQRNSTSDSQPAASQNSGPHFTSEDEEDAGQLDVSTSGSHMQSVGNVKDTGLATVYADKLTSADAKSACKTGVCEPDLGQSDGEGSEDDDWNGGYVGDDEDCYSCSDYDCDRYGSLEDDFNLGGVHGADDGMKKMYSSDYPFSDCTEGILCDGLAEDDRDLKTRENDPDHQKGREHDVYQIDGGGLVAGYPFFLNTHRVDFPTLPDLVAAGDCGQFSDEDEKWFTELGTMDSHQFSVEEQKHFIKLDARNWDTFSDKEQKRFRYFLASEFGQFSFEGQKHFAPVGAWNWDTFSDEWQKQFVSETLLQGVDQNENLCCDTEPGTGRDGQNAQIRLCTDGRVPVNGDCGVTDTGMYGGCGLLQSRAVMPEGGVGAGLGGAACGTPAVGGPVGEAGLQDSCLSVWHQDTDRRPVDVSSELRSVASNENVSETVVVMSRGNFNNPGSSSETELYACDNTTGMIKEDPCFCLPPGNQQMTIDAWGVADTDHGVSTAFLADGQVSNTPSLNQFVPERLSSAAVPPPAAFSVDLSPPVDHHLKDPSSAGLHAGGMSSAAGSVSAGNWKGKPSVQAAEAVTGLALDSVGVVKEGRIFCLSISDQQISAWDQHGEKN